MDLIITDDLNDITNFIYYINIIELKNAAIAINGNGSEKLNSLVNGALFKICGEKNQFTKFSDSLIKFI